jgi:hypothetical protein
MTEPNTASTRKRGRSKAQQEAIDRYWHGLPVLDADTPLLIVVSEEDLKEALAGDPRKCALANAACRLYGSSLVLFFRSIAYIDLPNSKGEREVRRFHIGEDARAAIADRDIRGIRRPGGFRLNVPSGKAGRLRTEAELEHRRANKRAQEARRRKAEMPDGVIRTRKQKPKGVVPGTLRYGSGGIQMQKVTRP